MNLDHSRIAVKRYHYNTGGYMIPAEPGMAFQRDLATLVIAGILANVIVNWPSKRKQRATWVPGYRNGSSRPDQVAGVKFHDLFYKKNVTIASE